MNFDIIDIEIQSDTQLGFTVSGDSSNYLCVSELQHLGPAYNAGLKKNDLLLRINGKVIHNKQDLLNSVKINKGFAIVQVWRKRDNKAESMRIQRRHSIDVKTLHQNLVANSGHKVGMEINRSDLCNNNHSNKPINDNAGRRRYAWTLNRSDAKTMHSNLVNKSGHRVGMEISRSPLSARYNNTNRVKFFETKLEENGSTLSRIDESYKTDISVKPSVKLRKCPAFKVNPSILLSSSSSLNNFDDKTNYTSLPPKAHFKSESNIPASHIHSSSLTNHKSDYLYSPNQNRVTNNNNSNNKTNHVFSRSIQHINSIDSNHSSASNKRHSELYSMNYSTASISSLFDSFDTNAPHGCNTSDNVVPVTMLDYQIQWPNVYRTIKSILTAPYESSLTDYFKSRPVDQLISEFPVSRMYRYVTFEYAMKILFEKLMPSNADINISIDLANISKSNNHDNFESTKIKKTQIECMVKNNHRKLDEAYHKFKVDNTQLSSKKENLKSELLKHLTNKQNKDRMETQVDRLFTVFNKLGSLSVNLVISLSMKIFNDKYTLTNSSSTNNNTEHESSGLDDPCLLKYAPELYDDLDQFRKIQSSLEKSIIHFFSRFRIDSDNEVNKLFDRVYSELLNVSICLPLLEEKLKGDEGIMKHLSQEHAEHESWRKSTFKMSAVMQGLN